MEISTYPLHSNATSNNRDRKDNPIGKLALTTDASLSFFPTTLEEVCLLQNDDEFCRIIRACHGEEKRVPFALNHNNVLVYSIDGLEQVIFQSLVPRVLLLSYHAKVAVHPGVQLLYQFLRQSFFWPNISVEIYKNPMKLFQL